jgi:capsular polysaccharide export protein
MEAMITINSTSGISALIHNKPVLALGKAIYNFKGLTSQQSLSEFWNSPQKPEEDLIIKFKSYLINETQINGSFYSKDGIDMIIENLRDKI